ASGTSPYSTDFNSATALAATVLTSNSPDQKAASAGTDEIPAPRADNYVYYYVPSYVGFNVSPTATASGDELDNTLTLAPSVSTTYTISTNTNWGDYQDGSDSASDALPDHCIVVAPTASNVTVTLEVTDDVDCEPAYGSTADGTHSPAPDGIKIEDPSGVTGTTLVLDVDSGKACRTVGADDGQSNGWAGVCVSSGTSLSVNGEGGLYAEGSKFAPAIGADSGAGQVCGSVTQSAGQVVAYLPSGAESAVIGGSLNPSTASTPIPSGSLSLSGGTLIAYNPASSSAHCALSSFKVQDADFLCVDGSGTTPVFTTSSGGAVPTTEDGTTALYPCYVPNTWANSGTVSVPDGVPASGSGSASVYTAQMADLSALLNTGVSGSATDSLTQADGLAACLWLPGAAYDAKASTPSYYDAYTGITLADSSSADVTPASGLLANVNNVLMPYTASPDVAGTATYDETNLVQASTLSLSGGSALLNLNPTLGDLLNQTTVTNSANAQVKSNLGVGYQAQIMVVGNSTAMVRADGGAATIPGLASDGPLTIANAEDGVWAYYLQDGDNPTPADVLADWWAPTPSQIPGAAHSCIHYGPAIGNAIDPLGSLQLDFAMKADDAQAAGIYHTNVEVTVTAAP
ncbi:MAG: hypothetical protein LBM21_02495, partial [Coriobacteriales bacterium]|nr:hypothetical protein [Coriobacteriales bacterium]